MIKKIKKNRLYKELDESLPEFCFLFVGHWLNGIMGEDRKNVGLTIHTFLTAFYSIPGTKPALILKTSRSTLSETERLDILHNIGVIIDMFRKKYNVKGELPRIYLLFGELSDDEMNSLYNHPKVKVLLSLHKGEGFGRPILEFAGVGKPIICSNWSGPVDFLDGVHSMLVPGVLTNIHSSSGNQFLPADSKWFSFDMTIAVKLMRDALTNYNKHLSLSLKYLDDVIKCKYNTDEMAKQLKEYMDTLEYTIKLNKLPSPLVNTPVSYSLPTLNI